MNNVAEGQLFPYNPKNRFYEEEAPAVRASVYRDVSWAVKIASIVPVILIGAYALRETKIEQIASNYIIQMAVPGFIVSAVALVTLCFFAGSRLNLLNRGPELDASNSMPKALVLGWLGRMERVAAIHCIDPSATLINQWIDKLTTFENAGYSSPDRVYFDRETRENLPQFLSSFGEIERKLEGKTKTVTQICNLLHLVKRSKNEYLDRLNPNLPVREEDFIKDDLYEKICNIDPNSSSEFGQTPWHRILENMEFVLEELWAKIPDGADPSAQVFINFEIESLTKRFEEGLKGLVPGLDDNTRVRIALFLLLKKEGSIDEISRAYRFSVKELMQWEVVARSELEKLRNDSKKELDQHAINVKFSELVFQFAPEKIEDKGLWKGNNNNNNVGF